MEERKGTDELCVEERIQVFTALQKILCAAIQVLNFQNYLREGSLAHAFYSSSCARILTRPIVQAIFDKELTKMYQTATGEVPVFSVNRGVLPAEQRKRLDTVFCQTMDKVGGFPDKYPLLQTKTKGVALQFWEVTFDGEGGIDYGGLFRDSLREICGELQCQGSLDLILPCPNNKYMIAAHQDKWILNSERTSGRDLSEYAFIGRILSASIHSQSSLELDLAPHIWKQLLGQTPTLDDIMAVDERFRASWTAANAAESRAEWDELGREWQVRGWQDTLSARAGPCNLSMRDKTGPVDFNDRACYLEMWKAFKLSDEQLGRKQVEAMRSGFLSNVPQDVLPFTEWSEVRRRCCGEPVILVDELKAITSYSNFDGDSEHPVAVMFWNVVGSFSQKELRLLLLFTWGQSRMPPQVGGTHMTLKLLGNSDDNHLPASHTCFFALGECLFKHSSTRRIYDFAG
jgi:hypothetical protein